MTAVSTLPTSGTMRHSVMLPMYNPFTRSEDKAFSQATEAIWWKGSVKVPRVFPTGLHSFSIHISCNRYQVESVR